MATESPLFQSSMELLGHSISHFNGATELDRKLVILHLAAAIELLLKDLLLDAGESIYKNPKETITIHGCIEQLKNRSLPLPYLNKIELLIDERNSLQHRYGSPNELTTIFYMNITVEFFRSVLKDHYGQDFDEIIPQFADERDLMAFRMREPSDDSELENLKKLARVHPLGALLSAMTYLEKVIIAFGRKVGIGKELEGAPPWGAVTHRLLAIYGVVPPSDLNGDMNEVRRLRNLAAHGRKDPSKEDVVKSITSIEKYEKYLASLPLDEVASAAQKIADERRRRYTTSSADKTLSEANPGPQPDGAANAAPRG
jgi:hypothetical protein